jgi:hypothetical protein
MQPFEGSLSIIDSDINNSKNEIFMTKKDLLKDLRIKLDQIIPEKNLESLILDETKKSHDYDLKEKMLRFFINGEDLFQYNRDSFDYRFFLKLQEMIKTKTTEQKLKFIFVKIYQHLEDNLLKNIEMSRTGKLVSPILIKKNSPEFNHFFNWLYFDNSQLRNFNYRIYNPKKKFLRFNYRFINMVFQNDVFKKCSINFLNSPAFKKDILEDIDEKIEMIVNLIKLNRFKSENEFFKYFAKKTINKIPWELNQAMDARFFFLDKIQ